MQSDRRAPPKPRFTTTVAPNCRSSPCHSRTEELPTNTTPPGRGGFAASCAAKSRSAWLQRPAGAGLVPRSPASAAAVQATSRSHAISVPDMASMDDRAGRCGMPPVCAMGVVGRTFPSVEPDPGLLHDLRVADGLAAGELGELLRRAGRDVDAGSFQL